MKTLFTLALIALGFCCVAFALGGATRLWERLKSDSQFVDDHYFKFLIAVIFLLTLFSSLGGSWNSFLVVMSLVIVSLAIYEYRCSEHEARGKSEQINELVNEAKRLREMQLLSGVGWGRYDVLRKFRTTLYYRKFGSLTTTTGWRCAACSKNLYKERDAEIDHIQPKSKYPELVTSENNLQILCRSCNAHKNAYDGDDWKKTIHKRRRLKNRKN